jgi:hypothetical protein
MMMRTEREAMEEEEEECEESRRKKKKCVVRERRDGWASGFSCLPPGVIESGTAPYGSQTAHNSTTARCGGMYRRLI